MILTRNTLCITLMILSFLFSCSTSENNGCGDIAQLADGWRGNIVSQVDQSYTGWDVEIGDADNDGKNEILTTGCPDSRLYLFKMIDAEWQSTLLADNLADTFPGMGLTVKVTDLNGDGKNEILLGTGQEKSERALFYILQTDGIRITKNLSARPLEKSSVYTHNLAPHDLDGDGILEIIGAYCGSGEITQYNVDRNLTAIEAEKIHQLSGSGEESLIADVDNDGRVEYITSNGFRQEDAKVEIFEFDQQGRMITPARLVIDGFDGYRCFYSSIAVGDVDNDGQNEMIVGWKRIQKINKSTLIGYRVDSAAVPAYTFAYEDEDLDMGYFEKMMAIADADNDGNKELIISTRGDNASEHITSRHLGHVFMFSATASGAVQKTLLVDFNENYAESSWLAVGDADNDNHNEIILATGKGDRTKPGVSYIVMIEKE